MVSFWKKNRVCRHMLFTILENEFIFKNKRKNKKQKKKTKNKQAKNKKCKISIAKKLYFFSKIAKNIEEK